MVQASAVVHMSVAPLSGQCLAVMAHHILYTYAEHPHLREEFAQARVIKLLTAQRIDTCGGIVTQEISHAPARLYNAFTLKILVSLEYSVGVDRKLYGHLPYRRHLGAGLPSTVEYTAEAIIHYLAIYRYVTFKIHKHRSLQLHFLHP